MKLRNLSILALLPTALSAQTPREVAPLKHWPAPLYWQPSSAESRASSPQAEAESLTPQAQAPAGSLVFVAMTPCRVVDTRNGSGFTGAFGPPSLVNGIRTFPVRTSTTCTIPAIAQAYSFNVTAVPPGLLGYITIFPTGQPQPLASTLNDILGTVVANAAIVPAGTNGSVDVYANNATDLIIDINGYYAPQTGITLTQGSAGAPALSFSNDAGTGIFSSGTGTLNISTGGTSRLTVRADGDLDLTGFIRRNGNLYVHSSGSDTNTGLGKSSLGTNGGTSAGSPNTGIGYIALGALTTGVQNVGLGDSALASLTTAGDNTAVGSHAAQNTTASENTAVGFGALFSNTVGINNTAIGSNALNSSVTVGDNTAVGFSALKANTNGNLNVAIGSRALAANLASTNNVAVGASALPVFNSTTGGDGFNVAIGAQTMNSLKSGFSNVAIGDLALESAISATLNTAIGHNALQFATGSGNIGIGSGSGANLTSGSNNIYIGSPGVSADGGTIRIGSAANQGFFFLAGIRGVTTGQANAVPVVIDSNGQVGTVSSSRRFKEDIHDMGDSSSGLLRLRPVTFRYRQPYADGSKPVDYGLIAEEVAEVYPDLAVKGPDGQIETVQYQKLNVMLLNEVQKQQRKIEEQDRRNREQQEELGALKSRLADLEKMLEKLAGSANR